MNAVRVAANRASCIIRGAEFTLLFAALIVAFVFSTENTSAAETSDELLPSQSVLDSIMALPVNHGMHLGRAKVVGPFNDVARRFNLHNTGPQLRDYSLKMVWAPERRRALYAGANHASPHRLNDVWEFDLAAMAWVLLYAPDNPRGYLDLGSDYSDVAFQDGVLVTTRGGPAVIGHTWSGITYDPVGRKMLFMSTWGTDQDSAVTSLGGDPSTRYRGPPLWAFDPESRKWTAIKTPKPYPVAPYGAMLEWVPEFGGAIWHMNNWRMKATWLFDPSAMRWTDLRANGNRAAFAAQAPSRELVGYHDPARQLVIARQAATTYHFDTAKAAWSKRNENKDVPRGYDGHNVFYHDPVSGHGLLVDLPSKSLWSYDPESQDWKMLTPDGDPMPNGKKMLAYMDQARNVLVVVDDVQVWVFRYAEP